jgi:hypothetical protein
MGRPKKAASRPVEPEEESQEIPGDDEQPVSRPSGPKAAPKTAAKAETISKAEGVRRAMAEGLDDLDDIEDFLKKQYGISMPRPQISAYKAQQKARLAKQSGGETAPRRRAATPAAPAQAPAQQTTGLIGDIQTVRQLIAKHGAEGLKALVDALA